MQYTSSQYETFWFSELDKVTRAGSNRLRAACPVHGGDSPNTLSINLQTGFAHCFKCHGDGEGWSMTDFIMQRDGLGRSDAAAYVRDKLGGSTNGSGQLSTAWPFPFARPTSITSDSSELARLQQRIENYIQYLNDKITPSAPGWKALALYPYPKYKAVKVRFIHKEGAKRFTWYALTVKGGWMNPTKLGLEIEVYLAGTLTGAKEIILCNGEKAVDWAVAAWEVVATCLPNGEAHWRASYLQYFQGGATVYIIKDNDPTGARHGQTIGAYLTQGGVTAYLVELPGLPPKGDLWDYIEAGGTLEEFREIISEAPLCSATLPPKERRSTPTVIPISALNLDGSEPDLIPYGLTDTDNAQRMVIYKGSVMGYSAELDKAWLIFDQYWRRGDTIIAYPAAQATLRLVQEQSRKLESSTAERYWKFANNRLNVGGIHAMLDLARSALSIHPDRFDRHPFLINCTNGTLDLETNEFRAHRPEDLLTHRFPFDYDPTLAPPELFLKCLWECFGGSADGGTGELEHANEMVEYLQRIIGYLITGDVSMKAFFIFYGTGNNGKSTIIATLQDVLGDYAVTISPNTLTTARFRNPNNTAADIARTAGKRAIFAAEPTGKSGFDQGELKRLTQGDMPIEGIFKGRNPFEFLPTAKLIIEANNVPEFDAADKAFTDRMHLIEFKGNFPVSVGQTMHQQLQTELPQIFNWAIYGARLVMENGLSRPLEYAAEQLRTIRDQQAREHDDLEAFVEECLNIEPGKRESIKALDFLAYRPWCERNRQKCRFSGWLSKQLCERIGIRRGSDPKHKKEPAWLDGVEIKPEIKRVAISGHKPTWENPTDD